ncbi:MAG: bacterial Ig-like domain-containing protein, partial [Clostridia bacterium]|nr:bacterial Ig-like domain-containing protein [Clostridia bacterium]
SAVDLCPSAIPGKTLGDLVTIDGVSVTELVKKGKVARFNFYGDTMIFHIDNPAYLASLKENEYEIVILPGFRWMNWNRDDWGNWAGSNRNHYTPVDGTLVLEPIVFTINASDEVCVKMGGMRVLPGYKDTYYVGERIDMTSLVVHVDFASGAGLDMMLLESMVSYDFSAPGTATVTVEYDGMVATYEVTVLPAPETETETETETVGSSNSTESNVESTAEPATEAAPETDADNLVPEPTIQKGCGAALAPAGMILLCFVGFAFGRKEDRDA